MGVEEDGFVSYGRFRNFALLLPDEKLRVDPNLVWWESATMVPLGPPAEADVNDRVLLKAALAGAMSSPLVNVVRDLLLMALASVDPGRTAFWQGCVRFKESTVDSPRGSIEDLGLGRSA